MSKYCLLFSGEITNSFNINEVKSRFRIRFKLTQPELKIIFSGKNIILKKNLTQQKVLQLAAIIDEIGGISYIESMDKAEPLPSGISRDRRYNQRRIKIYGRRKKIRGGHLSNRRKNKYERRDIKQP